MKKSLIGKIVRHEGRVYQILSFNNNLVFAHSYGSDNSISETLIASKQTGKVIARKASSRKK